jgi:predicted DNA-binding transcriptional regulator
MRPRRVSNPEVEDQVLKILEDGQAVSIDYIAWNLGLQWVTARALLMSMALEGKIQARKTTKSWVFYLEKPAVISTVKNEKREEG